MRTFHIRAIQDHLIAFEGDIEANSGTGTPTRKGQTNAALQSSNDVALSPALQPHAHARTEAGA
jgi:hypothetical protein